MKDISNKLEDILFAGIIPLRNEKKMRSEWKKGYWKGRKIQELIKLDKKNLLNPRESLELQEMRKNMKKKDAGFWIIYWIFMLVLYVKLIVLLFRLVICESARTVWNKVKEKVSSLRGRLIRKLRD